MATRHILKLRGVPCSRPIHEWVASSNNTFTKRSTRCLSQRHGTPFYGLPRPDDSDEPMSIQSRLMKAVHYAGAAFADPTRADAVAALAEITGPVTLQKMAASMREDPVGQRILADRPVVSKATIPFEKLIAEAPDRSDIPCITFGQAYGCFLKSHDFDPDARDQVRFIEDEELAYIMLRYRQCHDFWHALTDLPPTVLGELGLKWLELFQTGLPIAALSSTVGSLRLEPHEREILMDQYLPWAIEQSKNMKLSLLNVYYEEEFETPLDELRERINLQPAPRVNL